MNDSSDPEALRHFVETLWTAPLGIATLSNLADAVEQRAISIQRVHQFLSSAYDLFLEESENDAPGDGVHAYRCVLAVSEDSSWHFSEQRPLESSTAPEYVYTVSTSDVVFYYHVDLPSESRASTKLNAPDVDWPTRLDTIEKLLTAAQSGRLALRRGAMLRSCISVVWLTYSNVKDGQAASHQLANRVRDQLGLIDKRSRTYLVLYRASSKSIDLYRPTPVHCPGERFRMSPDEAAHKEDPWGWTVDLERFAQSKPILDGCEELVATEIRLTPQIVANIEPLGMVLEGLGDGSTGDREVGRGKTPGIDDDTAFATRLQRGRTKIEILGSLALPIP